ncbi:MAG: lamin tail domain-containing protein [Actinomycetota bacterium]|nr:lamin tail domain-containing protein [Actinomycetota bacterium]
MDPVQFRGECHGVEAAKRLHEMVSGKRVRLVSRYSFSKSSRQRLRRAVYAQLDGEWRDVAQVLLDEGHALWMPNQDEYDRNLDYSTRAGLAARMGANLWDTDYCGVGPDQDAPLSVVAHWNAPGRDTRHLNGEYFELRNAGATPVALAGWWVRDSQLRRFTFPEETVLPAGGKLFVHVGKGKARGRHLYWGAAGRGLRQRRGRALPSRRRGLSVRPRWRPARLAPLPLPLGLPGARPHSLITPPAGAAPALPVVHLARP